MGYNIVDVFIRFAVVGSQICEIPRKFKLIARQGHPRSIESVYALPILGINRKFRRISYRGVPRRQPHRRSGLENLPSVGSSHPLVTPY